MTKAIFALCLALPALAQTVVVADAEALARQFRRYQPFLAVVGDTKWADGVTVIADPAAEGMTQNQRRTARLAAWRAVLDTYTADDLGELGYNAFESWIKPCQSQAVAAVRAAMGNPTANAAQMRAYVRDQFALMELSDRAPAWADNQGCSANGLHMGNPAVGTTSAFGAPVTAVAWDHPFTEIQITWLEALIRSQGQEAHFLLLSALPPDWIPEAP